MLLFVPAFFLLLYGYALNFDVQNIQLAVQDNDRTPASRELVATFVNSGYFKLVAEVSSSREYEELIDRGEARAVLVIPPRLQEDLLTGRRVPVQVIINGDNSNTATTVMGYALRALQAASAQYQLQAATRPTGAADLGRAARLVQPGAAQRAVSDSRADRVHRDDFGGHLHVALGRA